MRASRVVGLLGLWGGLAVAPAYAGPHGAAHGLHQGSPGAWIGLALAALIGLAIARSAQRRRGAAIVSLALLVGALGIESAVHSVHHVADPEAAASCAIFSASQHMPGACAQAPDIGPATRSPEPAPPAGAERVRPFLPLSSHAGRAPPVSFSA